MLIWMGNQKQVELAVYEDLRKEYHGEEHEDGDT